MSSPSEDLRNQRDTNTCPECDGSVEQSGGESVCIDCGLVVDDVPQFRRDLMNSPSVRYSNDFASPTNPALKDQGLLTNIDWETQKLTEDQLNYNRLKQIRELRKWQARLREAGSKEQNLSIALNEIQRMASALGLPNTIVQVGCVLYRQAYTEDLIIGWSIEDIATACLYLACRLEGVPRTIPELAVVARTTEGKICNGYRHIKKELNVPLEPISPQAYLPRFCSKLGLSPRVEQCARKILSCCDGTYASGNSPVSLAAAAIYLAAEQQGEKRTQQAVGGAAGVAYQTISTRSQELRELIDD